MAAEAERACAARGALGRVPAVEAGPDLAGRLRGNYYINGFSAVPLCGMILLRGRVGSDASAKSSGSTIKL